MKEEAEMDRRWWSNQMIRRLGAAATATMLALGVLPGPALALSPSDGGPVTLDPVVTINASAGDQFDPHVSGDLAAYTSDHSIRYYDFFTGNDAQVPGALGAVDNLSDVSNGKIVFSRLDSSFNQSIMVFDTVANSTTEIDAQVGGSQRTSGAIGSDTVAFIDYGYGLTGELVASQLGVGGTTTRVTTDGRYEQFPSVAPLGDLVVYASCLASPSNCDIHQAGWNGSSWVITPLTNTTEPEANADSDGVIVVYDANRTGERDIYWQSVGGGAEEVLSIAGAQRNPSVSSGVVGFESIAVGDSAAELFVYEIATNRSFRITSTPADESLNDVFVLPDGKVRVVWASGATGSRDVFGATFAIPPVVVPPTYAFGGFLQPVDPRPALNSMKAGAAVPVKFSLGGDRGLDIFAAGYPRSQVITCDSTASVDGIEQTVAAGGSSLQYDALADVYTYVWKTDKAWAGTCRQLVLGFADGTYQRANFKLK